MEAILLEKNQFKSYQSEKGKAMFENIFNQIVNNIE